MLHSSRCLAVLLIAFSLCAPRLSHAAESAAAVDDWQFARFVVRRGDKYHVQRTFGRRVFFDQRRGTRSFGEWHEQRPIGVKYLNRLGLPAGATAWHLLDQADVQRLGLDLVVNSRDFYFLRSK